LQQHGHYEGKIALENNICGLMNKHNELKSDYTTNFLELNEKFENETKLNERIQVGLKYDIKDSENNLNNRTINFEESVNEQNKIIANNHAQIEQLNNMINSTM